MLRHFQGQRVRSFRLLAWHMLLAGSVGLAWSFVNGVPQGLAFALGVLPVAIGHFLQARVSFAGGAQPAAAWFGRFLLAVLLKWGIVIALLLLSIRWLSASPLAALAGITVSLLAIQLFNFFDAKVKRGS